MDSVSFFVFSFIMRDREQRHTESRDIHTQRKRQRDTHTHRNKDKDHTKDQACTIKSQVPLPREPSYQRFFCLFKSFVIETITEITDGTKYFF